MENHENRSLEDLEGEIWKEIEGYGGDYFVSNLGRVKSFKKWNGTDIRILKSVENSNKHLIVDLYKNGEKGKTKQIHVLMYETFIGEIPKGCVVHHIDFTTNNFLDNFQMMTDFEHRSLHNKGENHPMYGIRGKNNPSYGKKRPGEKSGNHTLTEQNVIEIRIDLDEGILNGREIGEKFGVSRHTISRIKTGKLWKHIKLEEIQ